MQMQIQTQIELRTAPTDWVSLVLMGVASVAAGFGGFGVAGGGFGVRRGVGRIGGLGEWYRVLFSYSRGIALGGCEEGDWGSLWYIYRRYDTTVFSLSLSFWGGILHLLNWKRF